MYPRPHRARLFKVSASLVSSALEAALFLTALAGAPLLGAARGPSTPEERQQALRLTKALEDDPLNKDAKTARKWLLGWLTEIPDISVEMCPALFGNKFEVSKEFAGEIALQQSLSGAAFIIGHPDQAGDKRAVALAGVEGALRAYEAILLAKPEAHLASVDALLQARSAGTLNEVVAHNLKACH